MGRGAPCIKKEPVAKATGSFSVVDTELESVTSTMSR